MADRKEHAQFRLLIAQTRVLCTVVDNAAEILSDEFKDMVQIPLKNVQDVLRECPEVPVWDGAFSEDDLVISTYKHESHRFGPDIGVRIQHIPTGLSVESYSKNTRMDNQIAARKALSKLVERQWEEEQAASEPAAAAPRRRRKG